MWLHKPINIWRADMRNVSQIYTLRTPQGHILWDLMSYSEEELQEKIEDHPFIRESQSFINVIADGYAYIRLDVTDITYNDARNIPSFDE